MKDHGGVLFELAIQPKRGAPRWDASSHCRSASSRKLPYRMLLKLFTLRLIDYIENSSDAHDDVQRFDPTESMRFRG